MATHVAAQATVFSITDSNLYVPVVTLSTQAYTKLLEQSKSDFKITINWTKYQSGISYIPNWSKFSKSKQTFCFIIWE